MNVDGTPPTMPHVRFNASDADLRIQSCDGVMFHIHRKNLETNTGAFPGPEFDTRQETVHLTEPAKVLELVFQFIYPQKHPTLKGLNFKTITAVAEAVEKYDVFSAMTTCEVRLSEFLPEHAEEVFWHGVQYDYPGLMDKAAFHLLSRSTSLKIWGNLPPHLKIPWAEYRNSWMAIIDAAIGYIQQFYDCDESSCVDEPLDVDCVMEHICDRCRVFLTTWVADLERINGISAMKNHAKDAIQFREDPWVAIEGDILCRTCKGGTCRSLRSVARIVEFGIEKMKPLSHFFPHSVDMAQ